ncbi:hypothetical protein BGLT_03689 [Caballeronia glathei]|uniref:Uncharacterized protein n=1 Tax=Caballeronia glathei TaxID=60547 RepID=A0A069PGN9_9BURK|nr:MULTISPECIES: hypothetical protein [Burkholderiaceae]KDR39740.1 hypothetical protein BG61_30600 [Caballeronia glathei]TCK39477.1 hypothetical protein B0G84_4815 [Paraburkholderia sp. BL8N3]CDY74747.1 hypothetical protein BGLT_03689 [Caballeronia glathei]
MAVIVIKDLADSLDLDREAMTAIVGGARTGAHQSFRPRPFAAANRVFSYPGMSVQGVEAQQPGPFRKKLVPR